MQQLGRASCPGSVDLPPLWLPVGLAEVAVQPLVVPAASLAALAPAAFLASASSEQPCHMTADSLITVYAMITII